MNRRTVLQFAGISGTAAMAGCLADGLGSDPDGNGDGESAEDDDTPTDESGDSADGTTDGDPDRSPAETVVAFYEAIADDDLDRVDELRHGDAEPFAEDDLEGEPTVEATETIAIDDDTATVEMLVMLSGASVATGWFVDLEREDGTWRVRELHYAMPDDETVLRPNARFEIDRGDESQQVTHVSGDEVQASTLYVRGDGLEQTGSWTDIGGDASGGTDDEPTVTAGDSVTVGVEDEYSLAVVWDDGEVAVGLAQVAGATDTATASSDSGR
ncbi:hypothetical protein [Halobiforma nitratireducens]|uniref:Cell surface glycoprotein n=1 Tax=Halobiforma nitratireducens JCM 10879 TaxID=1227454 RepID=M0LDC7_9EURY|nr:hypothetical protein [Halobiforma nitratireducens]EMA30444.1 cell surface glycoprotein [Halobiforma nitratireducens JCM 10879]